MKSDLIFPQSFYNHLNEIAKQRRSLGSEFETEVKEALQYCHHIGVIMLHLSVTGAGDSGEYSDIIAEPYELRKEIPTHVEHKLNMYAWNLAEFLNPGYEINEGGGYECTVSFYPFSIEGRGYVNVITEETTSTFKIGADQ